MIVTGSWLLVKVRKINFKNLEKVLVNFSLTEKDQIQISSCTVQDLQCNRHWVHSPGIWWGDCRSPLKRNSQRHYHKERAIRRLRHRARGNYVISRENEYPWAECVLHRAWHCSWKDARERKTSGRILLHLKSSDHDDCSFDNVVSSIKPKPLAENTFHCKVKVGRIPSSLLACMCELEKNFGEGTSWELEETFHFSLCRQNFPRTRKRELSARGINTIVLMSIVPKRSFVWSDVHFDNLFIGILTKLVYQVTFLLVVCQFMWRIDSLLAPFSSCVQNGNMPHIWFLIQSLCTSMYVNGNWDLLRELY